MDAGKMNSILDNLPKLSYPAISWTPGIAIIIYRRETLCVLYTNWLAEELMTLQKDKIQVLDSQGNYFRIVGYEPIPPFQGWKWFWRRLVYRISFVKPLIADLRQLDLHEYKKKLAWAMHAHFQAKSDKYNGIVIIRQLKTAKTHQEAMACVLKLWP